MKRGCKEGKEKCRDEVKKRERGGRRNGRKYDIMEGRKERR